MKKEKIYYILSSIFALSSLYFALSNMTSWGYLFLLGSFIFLLRGLYEDFDNIEY